MKNKKSRSRYIPETSILKSLLFLTLILPSTSLLAATIKLEYAGTLDSVPTPFESHFSPGDLFTGTVTYSTSEYNGMLDGISNPDSFRSSGIYDVVTEFTLDIGDFNFYAANIGFLDIRNDHEGYPTPDLFDDMRFALGDFMTTAQYEISPEVWNFIDETAGPLNDEYHMDEAHLHFVDDSYSVFTDQNLPQVFPGLESFTKATLTASFYENGAGRGLGGYAGSLKGTVTSVDVVSHVPVPHAIWLFFSGITALLCMSRRRNIQSSTH